MPGDCKWRGGTFAVSKKTKKKKKRVRVDSNNTLTLYIIPLLVSYPQNMILLDSYQTLHGLKPGVYVPEGSRTEKSVWGLATVWQCMEISAVVYHPGACLTVTYDRLQQAWRAKWKNTVRICFGRDSCEKSGLPKPLNLEAAYCLIAYWTIVYYNHLH